MGVVVEFFGVARARAGVPHVELPLPSGRVSCRLSELLAVLADRFPTVAEHCLCRNDGWSLAPAVIGNIDGQQFVSGDPELQEGQTLLLLPADAGG